MYRDLVTANPKKPKSEADTRSILASLQDPGPDVLVCDEAHTLKQPKAGVTAALQGARTSRRVALTGSPLQNNLNECEPPP
jgi:transcriptional regulator ATRX